MDEKQDQQFGSRVYYI